MIPVFDTRAFARRLTGACLSVEQADGIMTWRCAGAMLAQILAIIGGVLAMPRLLE